MGKGSQESGAKIDVYISADSVVNGHLQTKSNIKVDGKVGGNISAAGNVHVGSNAVVEGDVMGIDAQIVGIVTGNVNISGDLHVYSSAKLFGDVSAASMEVEKGAQYKGAVTIGVPIEENESKGHGNSTAAPKEPAAPRQSGGKKEPAEKTAAENGASAKEQPPANAVKTSAKK
jgi:cytoskeletal protein CcmA (bactofilin family)